MTNVELQLQDCVVGMSRLPGCSVDVVPTSPGYNIGTAYTTYDDSGDRSAYLKWTRQWVAEVKRVLRDDGSLFLNVGAIPSNPFLPHEIVVELKELMVLQNTFHWVKSISIETKDGQTLSAGHFKPIRSRRFVTDCHEFVFHFTKAGNTPLDRLAVGVPYADKSNVARWTHTDGKDRRCRGNTWFIPYQTIQNRDKDRPHPATFPQRLAEQCIRLHGVRDDLVVMDPFLGIGTAGLAARECGVGTFIGFEIDPAYFRVAQERLGLVSVIPRTAEPVQDFSDHNNKVAE